MSKEKHLKARKNLGLFFAERRKQMGHNRKAVADFIGISENTLERIEQGLFDYDISLLFTLCETLEIKPFFVLKEQEKMFSDELFKLSNN